MRKVQTGLCLLSNLQIYSLLLLDSYLTLYFYSQISYCHLQAWQHAVLGRVPETYYSTEPTSRNHLLKLNSKQSTFMKNEKHKDTKKIWWNSV